MLTLELVTGGDLYDYVETRGGFSERLCRFIFKQLLEGVNYIHSQEVAHLDLKLENIFVDGPLSLTESSNWIKIGDFGLSESTSNSEVIH